MSNLKPCPFCGFEHINLHLLKDDGIHPEGAFIECPKCGIETNIFDSTEEAVEFWNRRSDEKTM